MASDITLAVGDGTRRMTYAELAQARGISLASARRLSRRHRWPRQVGNDGVVRILVPLGHLQAVPQPLRAKSQELLVSDVPQLAQAMPPGTGPGTGGMSDGTTPGPAYAVSPGTQADAGPGHIRAFENAIGALREQLDVANQRVDRLERQLDEERTRSADALTAERIARDEAAGLRTELDTRKQWGLWRRVRGR